MTIAGMRDQPAACSRRLPSRSVDPLEARSFLGAFCGIARRVGLGAGASELATVDDQILVSDRSTLKPAFEDFARAGSIPSLRGQRRAGDVRGHAVVRHAPPSMRTCAMASSLTSG